MNATMNGFSLFCSTIRATAHNVSIPCRQAVDGQIAAAIVRNRECGMGLWQLVHEVIGSAEVVLRNTSSAQDMRILSALVREWRTRLSALNAAEIAVRA